MAQAAVRATFAVPEQTMKHIILSLALPIGLTTGAFAQSTGHDHAGHNHAGHSHGTEQKGPQFYGAKITADGAMTSADFLKAVQGKDSMEAKLQCEIITSCTKKGCWMDTKMADGSVMKVRFQDYGFFVPTHGLEGKKAVLQGMVHREVTTVAMLRHYAEDAGQSKEEIAKITEPKSELMFTAVGVIIE